MLRRLIVLMAVAVSSLATIAARAPAEAQESPIVVEKAWARATSAGAENGVVYLTISNTGATQDRLISAVTPVADMAALHEDAEENGMMAMREVGPLDLDPGTTRELRPGGIHLMLMGLQRKLAAGDKFPLDLIFEKAGRHEVEILVEKPGAMRYLPPEAAPQQSPHE